MKSIVNFILFLVSMSISNILVANDTPVMVMKVVGDDKEVAFMYPAVDGPINLFYEPTDVTIYERTKEDGFTAIEAKEIDVYYIGNGKEVEQINPGNYKRLVKKYLPDATELHQRIGKRGFRFENLPSMVLYYNKHKTGKTTPLTKKDITRIIAS